jgi:hypothetical protein
LVLVGIIEYWNELIRRGFNATFGSTTITAAGGAVEEL